MLDVIRPDLVGEVAGEKKMLFTGAVHMIGEAFFAALAADKDRVALHVFARPFVLARTAIGAARVELRKIMVRTVQPIGPECRPRRTAFHKADAQFWILIEHSVIDHAGKRDHQLKRMT